MTVNPQVSILIPVYNVSPFIERCAHTLFCQTFQDIEFIFVNDCTPDDSMQKLTNVIEQYSHRKKQIKIIQHDNNKGIGDTRNTLLDNACGKYFLCVDSDDYIEHDMIELLYNKAEKTQADIIVCDFYLEYKNSKKMVINVVFEDMNKNQSNVISDKLYVSLSNKMINRELYDRCRRLPEGLYHDEDRYIVVQLYFLTNKIAKVDKHLYHYNKNNPTSITSQERNRKHFESMFKCWDFLSEFLSEQKASDEHKNLLNFEKVKRKASFMISTNSYSLRKEFALKWRNEEIKFLPKLKRGKLIMTLLVYYKMFFLAQVYHYGVKLINRSKVFFFQD